MNHSRAWSNKDSNFVVPVTADHSYSTPIAGRLSEVSIPPERSLDNIEATLRRHITTWSPMEMGVDNPLTANERTLAASLCVHLNHMTRAESVPYQFHPEMPEGNRSLDMVAISSDPEGIIVNNHVYRGVKFFYVIEAKLLPLKGAREQEYVISHHRNAASPDKKLLGGIERFKQGIYAPNLTRCSMVAFVQDIPAMPWMAVINGWIDELSETKPAAHVEPWTASDHLVTLTTGEAFDECTSCHTRPSPALHPVGMRHFFLYLAGKN